MKQTTLIALAVIAAAAVGAAIVATQQNETTVSENADAGGLLFPDLAAAAGSAASLSIDHQGGTLTFLKGGSGWTLEQADGFSADDAKVNGLLANLATARKAEPKTAKPENYALIQVEAPDATNAQSILISATDETGAPLASLIVGKPGPNLGPDRSTLYARKPDEAQSWLIETPLSIQTEPTEWLATNIMDIKTSRLVRLEVFPAGGVEPEIVVSRGQPADVDMVLETLPDGKRPKGTYTINQLGFTLETVAFEAVQRDTEAPGILRSRFETFDGVAVSAFEVGVGGERWWRITADPYTPASEPEGGETVLKTPEAAVEEIFDINDVTQGWLFKLPDYKARQLTAKLDDLIEDVPEESEPEASGSGATAN
ncbi:MAG: DUF4340 domain-containing protein [Pseudomonadota bacterium]